MHYDEHFKSSWTIRTSDLVGSRRSKARTTPRGRQPRRTRITRTKKKISDKQDSSASFDDADISIITHYLPIVYSKNEHRLVGAERAWQRAQRAKQIHVHLLLVQSTVPMCTGRSAGTCTCVSASLLRDLELAHQVRIYVEQSSYISCKLYKYPFCTASLTITFSIS